MIKRSQTYAKKEEPKMEGLNLSDVTKSARRPNLIDISKV